MNSQSFHPGYIHTLCIGLITSSYYSFFWSCSKILTIFFIIHKEIIAQFEQQVRSQDISQGGASLELLPPLFHPLSFAFLPLPPLPSYFTELKGEFNEVEGGTLPHIPSQWLRVWHLSNLRTSTKSLHEAIGKSTLFKNCRISLRLFALHIKLFKKNNRKFIEESWSLVNGRKFVFIIHIHNLTNSQLQHQ